MVVQEYGPARKKTICDHLAVSVKPLPHSFSHFLTANAAVCYRPGQSKKTLLLLTPLQCCASSSFLGYCGSQTSTASLVLLPSRLCTWGPQRRLTQRQPQRTKNVQRSAVNSPPRRFPTAFPPPTPAAWMLTRSKISSRRTPASAAVRLQTSRISCECHENPSEGSTASMMDDRSGRTDVAALES